MDIIEIENNPSVFPGGGIVEVNLSIREGAFVVIAGKNDLKYAPIRGWADRDRQDSQETGARAAGKGGRGKW